MPIITTIQQDCGNPGIMKQFSEISLIFMETNFTSMHAEFNSDMSALTYPTTFTPISQGTWGNFNWGKIPWGGSSGGQSRIRKIIPQAVQRCNWINIQLSTAEAFTSFGLSGISLQYNVMSSRQK